MERKRDLTPISLPSEAVVTAVNELSKRLIANVEKAIVWQTQATHLVSCLVVFGWAHSAGGCTMALPKQCSRRALALSLGCDFKRIQCNPDLLPTDITGASVFNPRTVEFDFRAGPIFTQILLADEINRTTPRTQAALLEAMAEGRVTVDGSTHVLNRRFLVIATQNPVDHEGTFSLPEAQLDRFLMKFSFGISVARRRDAHVGYVANASTLSIRSPQLPPLPN